MSSPYFVFGFIAVGVCAILSIYGCIECWCKPPRTDARDYVAYFDGAPDIEAPVSQQSPYHVWSN